MCDGRPRGPRRTESEAVNKINEVGFFRDLARSLGVGEEERPQSHFPTLLLFRGFAAAPVGPAREGGD